MSSVHSVDSTYSPYISAFNNACEKIKPVLKHVAKIAAITAVALGAFATSAVVFELGTLLLTKIASGISRLHPLIGLVVILCAVALVLTIDIGASAIAIKTISATKHYFYPS